MSRNRFFFPIFEYHLFYVLYPFMSYLLTPSYKADERAGLEVTSKACIRYVLYSNLDRATGYQDMFLYGFP
jgi:hypothetical protein